MRGNAAATRSAWEPDTFTSASAQQSCPVARPRRVEGSISNPSKGFFFRTFAVPRIRGAVLDELRKCDWVSRTGREKLQRLNRAVEKVLRDRGALRDEWVMQEMGVDERTYYEILELSSRNYMASLDEVLSLEDGDVSLEGILSDGRDGAAELLEREEELEQVVDALRRLP